MTDETGKPAAAADDTSAAPEAVSDEQIWKELEQSDSASDDQPDDPAPADMGAKDDGDDDRPPPGWNEADDDAPDDQPPSEDTAETPDQADDPWAKAPPELLKEREKMEHTIRSLNGRVRALTKRHTEALKGPSKEETDALAAVKTTLADKAGEYPDILDPVVKTIENLESRIARLDEATAKEREELLKEEWGTFTATHSDGFTVVEKNTDVWNNWLKDQPQEVRSIVEANAEAIVDGQAAADVVTRFKEHLAAQNPPPAEDKTPSPDPRRERQLRGAQATTSRSPRVTADPAIGSTTPEQDWEYFERLERQKAAR